MPFHHDEMFGIKLIWHSHVFPPIPYFDRSLGPDLPALMNFNRDEAGHNLARTLPTGHRCLVYVTRIQRFIWAIELVGTLQDGEAAKKRHGIPANAHEPFTLFRPIRFLARVEPWEKGPTRNAVCDASGVPFAPLEGDSHVALTEDQYGRMYGAIKWTHEYV